MLLYSLLHLSGYDLPIAELKNFRQLHSKTPGHPEYGMTPGVETTTGPLGQGISNAVGMALAEKLLAEEFNRPGHKVIDHYTYVFLGDGCLMEGISHEVCSLAGTLKLNKLIALWDDNGISIDGKVVSWFNEDTPKRFEAYHWNVLRNVDGHDAEAVSAAIAKAKKSDQPTLICCKTAIGKGSPNMAGSDKVHGSPLGAAEITQTRVALNWPYAPFEVPKDIYAAWDFKKRGQAAEHEWNKEFQKYKSKFPELASELQRRMQGDLSKDFASILNAYLKTCQSKAETIATRKASQNAIEALAVAMPEFMGGSADLTGSNLTNWSSCKPVRGDQWGNHINYGVREFGMSAIMNGIALHGGYIPFGGTFLTFSDYSRNAIRMAALMKLRSIFVFTHDSIGLGEDGPTHQSVEQVASLRLIPNLMVWRPCDTTESAVAWGSAIERKNGPSALIFSRQNCPFVSRNAQQIKDIARGGYVLRDSQSGKIDAVIIATGSEIALALQTAERLEKESAGKIGIRIVSMPSTTVFDQQDAAYKAKVLPAKIPRIAVEAGVSDFWWKYGCAAVHGVDTFGESAPAGQLYEYFGLTVDQIAKTVKQCIAQK
jgi:transketolase